MHVFNVRLGLATNSSSTHSLAFLPEGMRAVDYMGHHTDLDLGDFGWQHFTLASPEAKRRYLGVLLRDRLAETLPSNMYDLIIQHWLGTHVEDDDHIDHQSWMFLPSAFGTKVPDEQFVRELCGFLLSDRLVILGGNDNQQIPHPLSQGSFVLPWPHEYHGFVCRFDEEYKFWTLFNQQDGAKFRFRFDTDPQNLKNVPQRASTPELIDIKITNHCPYGCSYCYQGSSREGVDSDRYLAQWLADDLAELQVFEVALGGGEPTLHPDFVGILEDYQHAGIVANFTTRNLNWLRTPGQSQRILQACGAFAYSVQNHHEVQQFATLLDYHQVERDKASIQLVLGTVDMFEFEMIMKMAGAERLRTTLLGFKSVGRGTEFQPTDYSHWLDIVKDNHLGGVSVDTALAAEFETEILAADVPPWMISTKEGTYSCYLDLVEKKIGPSSYCNPEEMQSFDCHGSKADTIREIFQTFSRLEIEANDPPQPDSISPTNAEHTTM